MWLGLLHLTILHLTSDILHLTAASPPLHLTSYILHLTMCVGGRCVRRRAVDVCVCLCVCVCDVWQRTTSATTARPHSRSPFASAPASRSSPSTVRALPRRRRAPAARPPAAHARASVIECGRESYILHLTSYILQLPRDRYILHLTSYFLPSYHVCGVGGACGGARSTLVCVCV